MTSSPRETKLDHVEVEVMRNVAKSQPPLQMKLPQVSLDRLVEKWPFLNLHYILTYSSLDSEIEETPSDFNLHYRQSYGMLTSLIEMSVAKFYRVQILMSGIEMTNAKTLSSADIVRPDHYSQTHRNCFGYRVLQQY